jgi:ABC-2 type transport system ATP-binding protein
MLSHEILTVENLSYAFGAREVLRDVSFTVPQGSVTLLLGPNGAGKTTLFSLIAGLLSPHSGRITLPKSGKAGLSIVFQQPALDLDLTVQQNFTYHAGLYGLTAQETELRLVPLLQQLHLEDRRHEKVRNLNGGHRRRVEIIRALLTNPSLILLDEPTAGLDPPTRKALVDFLHKIVNTRNIAVLWATHLTDEAASDDDVIILHKGKIRCHGKVGDVLRETGTSHLDDAFHNLTTDAAT